MKLLFIEDDPSAIKTVIRAIERAGLEAMTTQVDFDGAHERIAEFEPDIISLDLLQSGTTGADQVAGQPIYKEVWANHFCPIIVYSAEPEMLADQRPAHPFLRTVAKGSGSAAKFLDALNLFAPHTSALRTAKSQMKQAFTVAMRELAPEVFGWVTNDSERLRIITRSGRRRLAAMMDDALEFDGSGEKTLAPWEHYLCPPITPGLLLGDILRLKEGKGDATDFRIVLSPSCDLVSTCDRRPKIENVLVAACVPLPGALQDVQLFLGKKGRNDPVKLEAHRKDLKQALSQAYIRHLVPFPKFGSVIPSMAADLKRLELVPFDRIGESGDLARVSSIDSPFREVIAWAYFQIAARPGLPDRNVDDWCTELISLYEQ